jgi:branched-chain amino acid transport system substrate-binding protein
MKKWLSVVAVVVLCLALVIGVACGGGGGEDEVGVKEVKFGAGLPLSGIYGAVLGIPQRQGYELAADLIGEFTVAGQSYKWKLIFENNGWSSEGGVASGTKLIFEDGVKIMTQCGGDSAVAAQTICEESGVILFTIGVPMEAFGPDKHHTFQPQPGPYPQAATLFKYVSEARPELKTAAAVGETGTTGTMLAEAVADAAEYFGLEWVGTEYFDPLGATEFYPIATKMMTRDPDMCYMDTRPLVPMRELGWEGTSFFGLWATSYGEGMDSEDMDGYLCYYPAPYGEGLPEAIKEITAEYEQRFSVEFDQMALYSVLQLYFLTDALKKAGTVDDVDQIIATLETETFDSPIGPVKFGLEDLDGIGHQCLMPCQVGEIRDGEYHRVFELSTEEGEALAMEIWGQ